MCDTREVSKKAEKDAIIKITFFVMERASAKMDGTLSTYIDATSKQQFVYS